MSIMDIYGVNSYMGPGGIDAALPDFDLSIPQNVPGMTSPAISFRNAPVDFMMRQNNPAVFDPMVNAKNFAQSFPSNVRSGISKGFDLGKSAIGGLASLALGIPGLGFALGALQETPEQSLMKDFYGNQFGLDSVGRLTSGIMAGYAPVSGFGTAGLSRSIDKRMARIQKTLKTKKSKVLEQRLKDLQALKDKEEKARRDATRSMAAANKAAGKGGYQSDYAKDTGFMEGPDTSKGESFSDVQGST
jgi:hypothetical protein